MKSQRLHVRGSYVETCRQCVLYICTNLWFLCSHTLSVFSSTKCVHFLRAISSAEEFSPLPMASSTTGGPIILIPYRDGEGEERGGVTAAFKTHSLPFHTVAFFKTSTLPSTRAIISVTESRSQKYLLANSPLPETQSEILMLPDCSTLNHWIVALRERHAHVPRRYLTTICQHTSLKSNFR